MTRNSFDGKEVHNDLDSFNGSLNFVDDRLYDGFFGSSDPFASGRRRDRFRGKGRKQSQDGLKHEHEKGEWR